MFALPCGLNCRCEQQRAGLERQRGVIELLCKERGSEVSGRQSRPPASEPSLSLEPQADLLPSPHPVGLHVRGQQSPDPRLRIQSFPCIMNVGAG